MDEDNGEFGTGFSVDVCQKWESTFNQYETPLTRKVIIRTAIVLGKDGGAFAPLKRLAKIGFGGRHGSGDQYFSWLHENDFVRIIDFIITHSNTKGVYNLAAPNPVPSHHVMKAIRSSLHIPFGMPLPEWLLTFGAWLIGTETELVLKSRRVVPKRLIKEGYKFEFERIDNAIAELCSKT